MKKLLGILVLGLLWCNSAYAEKDVTIDIKFVLNNSKAGKEAQDFLKKSLLDNNKKFSDIENNLKKEETDLLEKKNILSKEEYQKKTDILRKKVIDYQSQRRAALDKITTQRAKLRETLLEKIDSILNTYIKENDISSVVDKKHMLGGKPEYDITKIIVEKLNKELPSLNLTQQVAKKKPKYDDKKIIIIGSGSGFFVTDQGHVVSNDHVIGICKKVITYVEGEEIVLKILATDMVNDIGLVKGKFQSVNYLNIKPDGAELGEDIVAFGYPLSRFTSDSVKLTKGIVSSLSGPGNNFSQIQIDAAIQPGSSGGPILNMNGQVVGVAVSGLSKKLLAEEAGYIPENVNFAVAAQSLTTFLKGNKISVGTGGNRKLSTKELAKIGEPATIQLFCMNTEAEYAKLKEADKHSDVLLDLK